jgi:RimJ/RimL family protein N-acetyltransferase
MAIFGTERLYARPFVLDDAEDAFAMYGDPEVMRYLMGSAVVQSVEEQRSWLAERIAKYGAMTGGLGAWALVERASERVVGTTLCKHPPDAANAIAPDVEIGWHLARRCWGRGYATEAGNALIRYGLHELGLERLIALIEPPNARSVAVAQRIGMTSAGLTRAFYGGDALLLWERRRDAG